MTRKRDDTPTRNDFDREFRAQLAQMTFGLAPTAFASAFSDWAMHLAQAPAKQNELQQRALQQAQDTHCRRCSIERPVSRSSPHRNARRTQRETQWKVPAEPFGIRIERA